MLTMVVVLAVVVVVVGAGGECSREGWQGGKRQGGKPFSNFAASDGLNCPWCMWAELV